MNARSELARTSRAAAPIAAPKAAKAAPPAPMATRISGVRAQSTETSTVSAASNSSVTANERDHAKAKLLDEQAGRADAAAGDPRERVLLALERERAGDQQHRHEHQRDRRRDRDREDVERRRLAGDDLLVDRDRLGDRAEQRQRQVEVVAGDGREVDDAVERRRSGRVRRQLLADLTEDRRRLVETEDVDVAEDRAR